MRLAVLGASGRIGQHVLTWALESGHQVTALARNSQSLAAAAGLTVLTGDATEAACVAKLVTGADAVLSALGPRGAKSPALMARAGQNIVAGMDAAGVRRLVCVSASGAFIQSDPDSSAMVKMILPRVLAKPFADVREMEAAIAASGLDWTLVRATRLVNSGATGRYRVRPDYPPQGGWKISRSDVAQFMAAVLTEHDWIQGRPALAY
jgi:putative NADH-flavin reductase